MTGYPQYLYCYFPIESGISFLDTLKFRLSSVSDFNDPFESLFETEYPYFFLSFNEQSTIDIIEDRIAIMNQRKWPNVAAIRNKSIGLVNLIKNLKIGCFSETPDNILMWGHYARKFTGIVVKFRVSLADWGNDLKKVEYNNDRISITSFNIDTYGALEEERALITRKSINWEYEREWRYIRNTDDCPKDSKGYYKKVNKTAVKEVILGCRICPNDLEKIKDVISKNFGPGLPISIVLPSQSNYSLEIKDLSSVEFALKWNKKRKP